MSALARPADARRYHVDSAEEDARYGRLTVPPEIWMALQGTGHGGNLPMNVARCAHDPEEAKHRQLAAFARHLPAVHYA